MAQKDLTFWYFVINEFLTNLEKYLSFMDLFKCYSHLWVYFTVLYFDTIILIYLLLFYSINSSTYKHLVNNVYFSFCIFDLIWFHALKTCKFIIILVSYCWYFMSFWCYPNFSKIKVFLFQSIQRAK